MKKQGWLGRGLVLTASIAIAASACGSETPGMTTTAGDAGPLPDGAPADARIEGRDATAPPPATGPLTADVAARAAVVLASCITEFGADSVLDQMYSRVRTGFNDYRALAPCLASRGNGCAAIAECAGVSADLTGPCAGRCDGNVAEGCDDQFKSRVDCAFYGRECTLTTGGSIGCALPGAASCDPASSTARRCGADGRPIFCNVEREDVGPNCAALGLVCAGDGCKGTEGSCSAVHAGSSQIVYEGVSCSGAKLSACVRGGLTTLDCGSLIADSTCQTRSEDGGTESYCGLAADCKLGAPVQAACDGDSVVVCNGGRVDRVDCKSLGFTGCVATTRSAYCSPSLKAAAIAMQDGG